MYFLNRTVCLKIQLVQNRLPKGTVSQKILCPKCTHCPIWPNHGNRKISTYQTEFITIDYIYKVTRLYLDITGYMWATTDTNSVSQNPACWWLDSSHTGSWWPSWCPPSCPWWRWTASRYSRLGWLLFCLDLPGPSLLRALSHVV